MAADHHGLRTVLAMYEIGSPGAWGSSQAWKSRLSGLLHRFGAIVLASLAVAALSGLMDSGSEPMRAPYAVAAAGAAAACGIFWLRASRCFAVAARGLAGVQSEHAVRDALRRTNSVAVAYGLVLTRNGEGCDAVVITGHGGVAAIEANAGSGVVDLDGDTLRAGKRRLKGSPVRQAAEHSRRLSRQLRRNAVMPVVCVPGMTNRPFQSETGVWVCSAQDLAQVLARAQRVFSCADEAMNTLQDLWWASIPR